MLKYLPDLITCIHTMNYCKLLKTLITAFCSRHWHPAPVPERPAHRPRTRRLTSTAVHQCGLGHLKPQRAPGARQSSTHFQELSRPESFHTNHVDNSQVIPTERGDANKKQPRRVTGYNALEFKYSELAKKHFGAERPLNTPESRQANGQK